MTPKKQKKEIEKDYSSILTITPEQQLKIKQLIEPLRQENVPNYWKEPHHYIKECSKVVTKEAKKEKDSMDVVADVFTSDVESINFVQDAE